jgi:mannose-6-phosphate isomerase-like protein (cupin superfamily)
MFQFEITQVPGDMKPLVDALLAGSGKMEDQCLTATSGKPIVLHRRTRQLSYVLEGAGYAYLDSDVRAIRPGDLILLNSNVPHSFAAHPETLRLLHWHWPADTVDEDRFVLEPHCLPFDAFLRKSPEQ